MPQEDLEWLDARGLPYELVTEGNVLRAVVYDFPVPAGYNTPTAAVQVRIDAGYPDAQLDMAWFYPALARADGRAIGATSIEGFDGKTWQRWSRHRTPANPWRPGVDNLATHFELVADWLARELRK